MRTAAFSAPGTAAEVGRFRPPAEGARERELAPAERQLIAGVESSLAAGVAMLRWYRAALAAGGIRDRFELVEVPNRRDSGFAFFATAAMPSGPMPVLGDVPRVFYDQPKGREMTRWCAEVREFALRYFMRISDFDEPVAVADPDRRPPIPELSLCPRGFVRRQGFGFEQLYYKRTGSGEIGRFPDAERTAIVDTRELGVRFDWVVASVRIFDFALTYPVAPELPSFSLPLRETAYVVLSADFNTDEQEPAPGICARYGFGYAMLRQDHSRSLLAYGPGHFAAGFQLFDWIVADDGTVEVEMPFVVNRPTQLLAVPLNPLAWGLKGFELATLGAARPVVEPLYAVLRRPSFDPIFTGVALANLFTLGQASAQLCISREQLEKLMLIFHFNQYYTMITGSLLTWRQVRDWLDEASLPPWVLTGRSA